MNDELEQLAQTLEGLIRKLSKEYSPHTIARAVVTGASASGSCDVASIARVCEDDLAMMDYATGGRGVFDVIHRITAPLPND